MTVDKEQKEIKIPVWLVSVILSVLSTLFIVWGSAKAAQTDLDRAKKDIESLRQEKVGYKEFTLIIDKLTTIEGKLDTHIDKD